MGCGNIASPIPNVPTFYKEVLAKVQAVCPRAIIGGGAVRDLFYGKTVKDIDIFVGPEYVDRMRIAGLHLKAMVPYGRADQAEYAAFWGTRLLGVYDVDIEFDCECPSAIPVQLIVLKHFQGLEAGVSDFDLGFSQIGFDGARVYGSPLFWEDYRNGTITVPWADVVNMARTERRLERMARKYPEKTVVRLPRQFPALREMTADIEWRVFGGTTHAYARS
jgi:hypothetical protein